MSQEELSAILMVEAHGGSGGPPSTLLDLAPELSRRRAVTIAIPPGKIAEELAARAPDANIILLPRWSANRRWLQRLRALPRLRRELDVHDVIHANGKSALNLVAPMVALCWNRPRLVVHFHDFELSQRNIRVLRLWNHLGLVSGYMPVSDVAMQLLDANGLGPVLGKLANPIPAIAERASFGGPPYEFAFVGSKQPRKGLDLMVEVAHHLRNLPCTWHIYGVRVDRNLDPFTQRVVDRLSELGLTDRVVWEGRQRGLARRLANHHALLLPSRQESFCRVAIEAMAAGLPVVAGDIPGLDEAVGEGNCVLFDLDDLKAASTGLAAIVADRAHFEALQAAGVARAAEFEPSRICDQLEDYYDGL